MPSLRGHMVFMSLLRDALAQELPELHRAIEAYWPESLAGSEGPDAWYFTGQTRPDTHALDQEQPETWPDAIERWLVAHPEVTPGKAQPPAVQSFVTGYLSHLGLDTWEEYQRDRFPADRRAAAPMAWYPPTLRVKDRLTAALRALGEAPFPKDRVVTVQAIEQAEVPERLSPAATRRVAAGIVPALALRDPWEISRVNPLRKLPKSAEARAIWAQERAALADATRAEYQALVDAALAFTVDAVRRWFNGE